MAALVHALNVWWIKSNKFQESYNVQQYKEIKRLKSLQVKADAYLEPKQASTMEIFRENT